MRLERLQVLQVARHQMEMKIAALQQVCVRVDQLLIDVFVDL
jgi:hypothetical protein